MSEADTAQPHLSREHLLGLLTGMVRVRCFEEKCAELYQQEKIRGFLISTSVRRQSPLVRCRR